MVGARIAEEKTTRFHKKKKNLEQLPALFMEAKRDIWKKQSLMRCEDG